MSSNEDTKASIQHAFIRQISLLRHLNRWLIYTWQYAVALAVLQTFCFSWHKLHRKRFVFPWLHTFETETSVLHNSIHRNLFISSSWLTWFLHISLSNSATWQNMFSYHKYIYHGLRNLLLQLEELYTFQLMARAGLSKNIPFTFIPFPYLPSRHQFTIPCHFFLITSLLYHYHVCMPWFPSHDQSLPLPTNTSILSLAQYTDVLRECSAMIHMARDDVMGRHNRYHILLCPKTPQLRTDIRKRPFLLHV